MEFSQSERGEPTFQSSKIIVVTDVVSQPGMNGTLGKLGRFDGTRWEVILCQSERLVSLKPEKIKMHKLQIGTLATLRGLSSANFNGKRVKCLEFDMKSSRWIVELSDDQPTRRLKVLADHCHVTRESNCIGGFTLSQKTADNTK